MRPSILKVFICEIIKYLYCLAHSFFSGSNVQCRPLLMKPYNPMTNLSLWEPGCGPKLAKDTTPCLQLLVNISLCKVQIHSIIISPENPPGQKRSAGSVVRITSWSYNPVQPQTFLKSFYLTFLCPDLTCQSWTEGSIHRRLRSTEMGGCDSYPASYIAVPKPSPSPNIPPDSLQFLILSGDWHTSPPDYQPFKVRESIPGIAVSFLSIQTGAQ